ncbi:hypothetical protein GCM10010520_68340 [Rhizobium viscosum]
MPDHSRLPALLLALGLTVAPALAGERQQDVILSVTGNTLRWAAAYKLLPERADDPYFHVRVFERQKGWEPWRYKELIFHMAVTPKALAASRIDRKARIYNYKDVEIWAAYHRWLDDASARAEVPVCETDILDCLSRLPGK